MASLGNLPVELCSMVMCYSTDKAALLPAVLSCRRFHDAYRDNKIPIHRQIRRNVLGGDSAVGAMIRRIRIQASLAKHSVDQGVSVDQFLAMAKRYDEDKTRTPSVKQYRLCFTRARQCDQLELLYSRSTKDRLTRETSRLSGEESGRFCAAVHRLSLIAIVLSPTYGLRSFCHDNATRLSLLYGGYSAQELNDMHHVLDWLVTVVQGLQTPQSSYFDTGTIRITCLCAGPAKVLAAYVAGVFPFREYERAKHLHSPDEPLPSPDGWKGDLEQLLVTHQQLLDPSATELEVPREIQPIVVLPAEPLEYCSMRPKCRTDAGCRLWNNENWKYLPPKFWLTKLVSWLKGPLIQNPHERALIKYFLVGRGPMPRKRGEPRTQKPRHFINAERDITLERVLDVLHELRNFLGPGDKFYDMLAKDKFSAVKSGDLLCDRCLEELVLNRLWVWWATVKSTMGKVCGNEPDCPYGITCTKQQDIRHAVYYNHLCLRIAPKLKADRWAQRTQKELEKKQKRKAAAEAAAAEAAAAAAAAVAAAAEDDDESSDSQGSESASESESSEEEQEEEETSEEETSTSEEEE